MTISPDGFDPNAAPWRDDPHPALADFRREQPVFRCPAADAWIVTRYENVASVVSDGERFSSADVLQRAGGICAQRVMSGGYPFSELRSIIKHFA